MTKQKRFASRKTRSLDEILKSLTPEGKARLEANLPFIARRVLLRVVAGGKKPPPLGPTVS